MKQLTDWLNPKENEKFFNETKERLPKPAKATFEHKTFKDTNGNDILKKAIFVSKKYVERCEKYVLKHCNIKSKIK
jgi:hypothetical protein